MEENELGEPYSVNLKRVMPGCSKNVGAIVPRAYLLEEVRGAAAEVLFHPRVRGLLQFGRQDGYHQAAFRRDEKQGCW